MRTNRRSLPKRLSKRRVTLGKVEKITKFAQNTLAGWRGLYCELSDRRSSRLDATILQHDDVIAVLRRQIHPRHGTRGNGVLNEMLYQ
ncbi:MAG: hypothetical protein OXI33_02755 [Chloroflexota bacterium]|nr:hypothetical protein [Chloroflexota bacterium]